jgi:4-diphosphocytidyl-2-C-methyl-D-erythritol kinase
MNFNFIKSYAKINLLLGVVGKIKFGLHKIESLVTFLNLYDEIHIKKINGKKHKIIFYGKFSKNISKNNTISNLLKILDQQKLLKSQKFFIKIKKNIPQQSGMGGGSMNAASLITYFLSKNIIQLSRDKTIKIANLIGSDVKLGLDYKNTILFSNQKLIRFKNRIGLFCVVAKPNFGCSTEEIFKKIKSFSKSRIKKSSNKFLKITSILKLKNDLEHIALKKYPKLKNLKLFMESLPKVKIVRMTGSGSAIIAYFKTRNASLNAAKILKKNYKNYWCILSKTI